MIVKEAITWAKEMIINGKAPIENIGHYVALENFFDSSKARQEVCILTRLTKYLSTLDTSKRCKN